MNFNWKPLSDGTTWHGHVNVSPDGYVKVTVSAPDRYVAYVRVSYKGLPVNFDMNLEMNPGDETIVRTERVVTGILNGLGMEDRTPYDGRLTLVYTWRDWYASGKWDWSTLSTHLFETVLQGAQVEPLRAALSGALFSQLVDGVRNMLQLGHDPSIVMHENNRLLFRNHRDRARVFVARAGGGLIL